MLYSGPLALNFIGYAVHLTILLKTCDRLRTLISLFDMETLKKLCQIHISWEATTSQMTFIATMWRILSMPPEILLYIPSACSWCFKANLCKFMAVLVHMQQPLSRLSSASSNIYPWKCKRWTYRIYILKHSISIDCRFYNCLLLTMGRSIIFVKVKKL